MTKASIYCLFYPTNNNHDWLPWRSLYLMNICLNIIERGPWKWSFTDVKPASLLNPIIHVHIQSSCSKVPVVLLCLLRWNESKAVKKESSTYTHSISLFEVSQAEPRCTSGLLKTSNQLTSEWLAKPWSRRIEDSSNHLSAHPIKEKEK